MKKLILASVSASLLLSGCAQVNNEGIGTVTGGVVGGLIGSQFGGGSGKVAAAAGGALLGAYLGGNIGRTMDRLDRLEMQRALETAPTGKAVVWQNPDSGNRYTVRPTRTYYSNSQPCREYTTRAIIGGKTQEIYGKACRQADGSWKVVS
ncbi:glycine zipper 2TM domain-containing protein [Legionella taurinensis]|uniref:Surface antigens (17 kDa) n=3 Tax=Legionella TaxID=445 RepID=A0A0W0XY37_9GAMM|nr:MULTISPECIES: RT0821/Lpp0805 family surface protein [Legionella]KTC95707.1 surface antigens (17 kDa) [Legionella erythra]KTD49545.1 surface antigens (17 kDa) [Legionella rubrilucens]MDX1838027.1 RT0821/Lpp0805 family surface protein [Legionella taurinensis]PUT39388.1 glycine zipper 2TM domain-containing protein [Legionella taurinensis]PUT41697.1 glycine zipper 2TM domain-containing protein [Legionella taurinensis]